MSILGDRLLFNLVFLISLSVLPWWSTVVFSFLLIPFFKRPEMFLYGILALIVYTNSGTFTLVLYVFITTVIYLTFNIYIRPKMRWYNRGHELV